MLAPPEYVDEEEWTSVIDDIDKLQLSEKCSHFIPLSIALSSLKGQPKTEIFEETKDDSKKVFISTCSLFVHMIPAFSAKDLSVYTDPQVLIQVGKKYTFALT